MTEKHNRLTLIETEPRPRGANSYGIWHCDCGNKHRAQMAKVRSGKIKSCGCLRRGLRLEGSAGITPFKLSTMRWV